MNKTENEVVFITGATGYLGSRLVKRFASKGFSLICNGTNILTLERLKKDTLRSTPDADLVTLHYDLSQDRERESLIGVLDDYNVSNFINCAAIQGRATLNASDFKLQDFRKVLSINLESSMYLTFYFANRWKAPKRHSIIHFSGGGATTPRSHFNSYSLSKTALVRFVENCSRMKDFESISINAIAPGVFPSRMQEEILSDRRLRETSDFQSAIASRSSNSDSVEKVLNLCEFLLSEASVGISGKLISAQWDSWISWPEHLKLLQESDLYTLRRITGRDRGFERGDV